MPKPIILLLALFRVLMFVGSASAETIRFRDLTLEAGIHFTHNNAAFGK